MKIAKLFPKRHVALPETNSGLQPSRRSFLSKMGWTALFAGLAGQAWALVRSLVPNVLYEAPTRFKAGPPQSFPPGTTFLESQHLFVTRDQDGLHAISAVCTHLGCTVKMLALNQPKRVQIKGRTVEITSEFHCPCHGSKYYGDGTNYAGPAPRPLTWYLLELAPDDGQVIVDLSQAVKHDFRLKV